MKQLQTWSYAGNTYFKIESYNFLFLPFIIFVCIFFRLIYTNSAFLVNRYCRWKWTHQPDFKSWMKQLAFHIDLIPLGKGINLTLLTPSIVRWKGRLSCLTFIWLLLSEKENPNLCSLMIQETGVQTQVESHQRLLKWHLIHSSLTLRNIHYVSRVKWSSLGKGVAPSPTPRFGGYRKGSLLVALDKRETTLLTYFLKIDLLLYLFISYFSNNQYF